MRCLRVCETVSWVSPIAIPMIQARAFTGHAWALLRAAMLTRACSTVNEPAQGLLHAARDADRAPFPPCRPAPEDRVRRSLPGVATPLATHRDRLRCRGAFNATL